MATEAPLDRTPPPRKELSGPRDATFPTMVEDWMRRRLPLAWMPPPPLWAVLAKIVELRIRSELSLRKLLIEIAPPPAVE